MIKNILYTIGGIIFFGLGFALITTATDIYDVANYTLFHFVPFLIIPFLLGIILIGLLTRFIRNGMDI